jgi:FkbM family methyltransferase
MIFHGVAAAVEHEPLLNSLDYRTVIDIGANRGQFALAVRRSCPRAAIRSFEPLREPADTFRAIFKQDAAVELYEAAIGPRVDKVGIHVAKRDDSSSLLPISKVQEKIFPGTGRVRMETIDVAPLEDFICRDDIQDPALLKLDVQGYELHALQGCERLLNNFSNVLVECSFVELYTGQALAYEVLAWLAERAFRLTGVYNIVYDRSGRAIQADFALTAMQMTSK